MARTAASARTASAARSLVLPVGLKGRASVYFDGTDDKVTGAAPGISGASAWTLVAWVMWTKNPGTYAGFLSIGAASGATGGFIGTYNAAGTIRLSGGVYNNYVTGGDPVTAHVGRWIRMVITCDGANIKLYVNGTQNGATLAQVPNITDGSCYLGAICGGASFFAPCRLDDARIYSRAWTPTEVAADSRNQDVSSTGLVRRWTCENPGYGTTCYEEIGGTSDVMTGAVYSPLVPFRRQRVVEDVAAAFDPNSAQHITVADHDDIDAGTGPFGMMGWFVASSMEAGASRRSICDKKYTDATGWHFAQYETAPNRLYFAAASGAGTDSILVAMPGHGWHHFAVQRDGTRLYLFIDAQCWATVTDNARDVSNTHPLEFGRYYEQAAAIYRYRGAMGGLIWRKGSAFTWDEIEANYYNGVVPAGSTCHWPMTEGAGTSAADVISGRNGTLSVASWTTSTRSKARAAA